MAEDLLDPVEANDDCLPHVFHLHPPAREFDALEPCLATVFRAASSARAGSARGGGEHRIVVGMSE